MITQFLLITDLRFIPQHDPTLTRSASVPVANHSVFTKSSSAHLVANKESHQLNQHLTHYVMPHQLPANIPREFRAIKDRISDQNAQYYPSVASERVPPVCISCHCAHSASISSATYTNPMNLNVSPSMSYVVTPEQGMTSQAEPRRADCPLNANELPGRNKYSTWSMPSDATATASRSTKQPPSQVKSDYLLRSRHNSQSHVENKSTSAGEVHKLFEFLSD